MALTDAETLALVQPGRSRVWEIRRGAESLATLRVPVFSRGGKAELDGLRLTIQGRGLRGPEQVIRDEATGEPLALLRREGRRRMLQLGGTSAEWKPLGRKEGHGFVSPDGEPLLRAKVSSGLFRTNGELRVAAGVPERDALLLALLAAYLLIRRADDTAAAVAGSTAAVSGGGA